MSYSSLSSCFVCFCMIFSVSMAWGDSISPCMEVRNVTIIPYITENDDKYIAKLSFEKVLEKASLQLRYLVKSLLDTPCFIIWIFSPIQSRLVRLTQKNYVQIFDSKIQAEIDADQNEIMNVLLDMPQSNVDTKQTIFFVGLEYYPNYGRKFGEVIRQILKKYAKKQNDIVVWSLRNGVLYSYFRTWLPKQNTIIHGSKFNPHLHRILLDLMSNPRYDWHQRYSQYVNIQCPTTKKLNIYFWLIYEMDRINDYYPSKRAIADINKMTQSDWL